MVSAMIFLASSYLEVTEKISEGCLTIIADSNKVQALKVELYQFKQAAKVMKDLVA